MLNYGTGYTGEFVDNLDLPELLWHVNKLHDKLEEEAKARKREAARVQQRQQVQQSRIRRR